MLDRRDSPRRDGCLRAVSHQSWRYSARVKPNGPSLSRCLLCPIHEVSNRIRLSFLVGGAPKRAFGMSHSVKDTSIEVIGADANNLKNADVVFRLECVSTETGV